MGRYPKDTVELWKDLYKKEIHSLVFGIVVGVFMTLFALGILSSLSISIYERYELLVLIFFLTVVGSVGVVSIIGVYRQIKKIKHFKLRLKVIDKWLNNQ